MLIMKEDMVWRLKIMIKPINCGKMMLIYLKVFRCSSNFQREESICQLEKMTMPLNASMNVGTMLRKSIT